MHHQSWLNLVFLRTIVVFWTLTLSVLAEEGAKTTADSARASQPGPDQGIVGIVPVLDTPPNIHHHGHSPEHEHRQIARSIQTASSSSTTDFPTAFDTSFSNNFTTTSCPNYFRSFLADSSFTNCHAVSTLLRDSTSFFHTLTSAASTSLVLDTACAADISSCTETMKNFASELLDDSNCGQDYADGNPLVTNAYYDMITYEPIYRATCLQNPDSQNYCFVDAVTNTSNPADYDVYSLPYGSTISSKPLPTCNACLQATLDVFSKWAQVEDQPLANSYMPSANTINGKCGPNFANVNITVGEDEDVPSSAASLTLSIPLWASSVLIVLSLT
ncbi:uncharacterized protein BDV14DRAFT_168720 [Aspergillus stella-maris]|uniref:uncharacterized protein n=1 Tax=Aspergillus stella-maris TaxID=1810926 RepID=UPI003CCCE14E